MRLRRLRPAGGQDRPPMAAARGLGLWRALVYSASQEPRQAAPAWKRQADPEPFHLALFMCCLCAGIFPLPKNWDFS